MTIWVVVRVVGKNADSFGNENREAKTTAKAKAEAKAEAEANTGVLRCAQDDQRFS
jgi:hypothetical protein